MTADRPNAGETTLPGIPGTSPRHARVMPAPLPRQCPVTPGILGGPAAPPRLQGSGTIRIEGRAALASRPLGP
eukprot:gene17276-biopygen8319